MKAKQSSDLQRIIANIQNAQTRLYYARANLAEVPEKDREGLAECVECGEVGVVEMEQVAGWADGYGERLFCDEPNLSTRLKIVDERIEARRAESERNERGVRQQLNESRPGHHKQGVNEDLIAATRTNTTLNEQGAQ